MALQSSVSTCVVTLHYSSNVDVIDIVLHESMIKLRNLIPICGFIRGKRRRNQS